MSTIYLAVDGDDVGRHLEYLVVTNQVQDLIDFFDKFQTAMKWLEDVLIASFGATILFNGGDNLLANIPDEKFYIQELEMVRNQFATTAHRTLSMGIGSSPRSAFIALKLAKAGGKNRTEYLEVL